MTSTKHEDVNHEWIIGGDAIAAFLKKGCWKTAKRWIKKYNAPLRRWIDNRPAFLRSEINAWLINTGEEIEKIK
jgi:nicotinic acid mononucleotide adenylyltransferase